VTPESLEEAAARLEHIEPGYLAKVRRRASALGVPTTNRERVRRSIGLTVETAHINADVPSASNRRVGRMMKRGISTLTRFYMLHVVSQVNEFAESSAWMGQALMDYTAALEAEVDQLRERVRCLEERLEAP
jgi:uncharacterized protein YceH (UPF0502 family)